MFSNGILLLLWMCLLSLRRVRKQKTAFRVYPWTRFNVSSISFRDLHTERERGTSNGKASDYRAKPFPRKNNDPMKNINITFPNSYSSSQLSLVYRGSRTLKYRIVVSCQVPIHQSFYLKLFRHFNKILCCGQCILVAWDVLALYQLVANFINNLKL